MAYIKAISTFTPPASEILTNDELQKSFQNVDIAKIAKGVGVNQRYVADENETAADMACKAANQLFEEWT